MLYCIYIHIRIGASAGATLYCYCWYGTIVSRGVICFMDENEVIILDNVIIFLLLRWDLFVTI